MEQKVINHEELTGYLEEMYTSAGLTKEESKITSELTVKSNLWGVDSHGVLRTPVYVKRVLNGAIKSNAEITVISDRKGPIQLMDGGDGMGYVVGYRAMEKAIDLSKEYGIGMVLVKNSNHFGAAGLYVDLAAEKGCLGICTTNVIPNIGMPGSLKPSTGNNPLALGAPLNGDFNFVLDISMSSVAGGKLLLAIKEGKKIPTNWAITKEGKETDDPKLGFEGLLLPMGMHKGFGMSLFIDIMTGVLSGGPFLQDLRSMYSMPDEPSLSTHMMMAIDPTYFMEEVVFEKRMDKWVEYIKSTPLADCNQEQLIPGEIEYKRKKQREKEGVSIPTELLKDLKELEDQLGMKATL